MTKDQSGPAHVDVARPSFPIGGLRKRIFDVVVALCGLVLLSPLLAAVACLLRVGQGSPICAREPTLGPGGRIFDRLTFRVVRSGENDRAGRPKDGAARVGLGEVLEKAGLTAMPQLLNVLRGEMSVVGPRPMPLRDLPEPREDWPCLAARPGLIFSEADCCAGARGEHARAWSISGDLRALWKAVSERRYTVFY